MPDTRQTDKNYNPSCGTITVHPSLLKVIRG